MPESVYLPEHSHWAVRMRRESSWSSAGLPDPALPSHALPNHTPWSRPSLTPPSLTTPLPRPPHPVLWEKQDGSRAHAGTLGTPESPLPVQHNELGNLEFTGCFMQSYFLKRIEIDKKKERKFMKKLRDDA